MAGSEHAKAEDQAHGPAQGRPDQYRIPAPAVSGLLALQRSAGNAAVGRLLAGRGLVAQRAAAEMTSATLEARAQEQIAKAQAERAHTGGEGEQPEGRPAPGSAEVAAEKARQRRAIANTVSSPDTSPQRSAAASATAEVKAAVQAPPTPVARGRAAVPPPARAGGASGPAAAAQEAASLADQAFAQAVEQRPPEAPPQVVPPEPVVAVDSGGRQVPADPAADAQAVRLTQQLQTLRVGAHLLHVQAAEERAQAHRVQGLIHSAESGIAQAEAGVTTLGEHTQHRRGVLAQAKQALEVSQQKAAAVAAGAPQVAAKSDEGRSDSAPLAAESKRLAAENASKQPEDSEAAGKSAEQGAKLAKAGADATTIDNTIGQTRSRADQLAADAAKAQQANTASQAKIAATEQALAATERKIGEMTSQNQAARSRLAGLAGGPAEQLAGAAGLAAQATELDAASTRLETRIHGVQAEYAGGMAGVPARIPRRAGPTVQRAGYEGRAHYDPGGSVAEALPSWLTGEDPPNAATRAQAAARVTARRRQEQAEIEQEAGGNFAKLSAADKAGIALRLTGRHLWQAVGETNFPRFIGNILRGFIDPRMSLMGIIHGMGMIVSGGANLFSAAQWKADPLGNLLKSAAEIATGVAVVLGSVAGLATAIAVILTAIAIVGSIFSFGAVGAALAPIIAFCGTVAVTVGPLALKAAAIALVLHGLVLIKNLIDAATADTAAQLQNESEQMTEDATNAGGMALAVGMAKAMEIAGKFFKGRAGGGGEEVPPTGSEQAPPVEGPAPAGGSEPTPPATAAPEPTPAVGAGPEPAPTAGAGPEPAPVGGAGPEPAPPRGGGPEPAPPSGASPEPVPPGGGPEPAPPSAGGPEGPATSAPEQTKAPGRTTGEQPVVEPPGPADTPVTQEPNPRAPRELSFEEKWEQMERALKEQQKEPDQGVLEGEGIERAVDPEAQKIADGHAWEDHRREFPEIKNQDEFAARVDEVMSNPTATKRAPDGRTAYWDQESGTIVIKDPRNPDGGTAYRPTEGRDYFDRWPNVGPPKD
jgi:hypothetical protein